MKLFAFLIIAFLSSSTFLFGQSDDAKKSLRGLSGVFVVVQPINEDASRDGLSATHVRNLVESSLGQAGVSIAKEPQQKDGFANLIITIDTIKQQGVYLFTVSVSLVQTVQLSRNA